MKFSPVLGGQDFLAHRDGSLLSVILCSCFLHAVFLSLSFVLPHPTHQSFLQTIPVSLVSLGSLDGITRPVDTDIVLPQETAPTPLLIPEIPEKVKQEATPIQSISAPQKTERIEPQSVEVAPLSPLPFPVTDEKKPAIDQAAVSSFPSHSRGEDAITDRQVVASIDPGLQRERKDEGTALSEGPLSNYAYYLQTIQNKINTEWSPHLFSRVSADQGAISSLIEFIVQRNGRIKDNSVKVEKSSGDRNYDLAAMRAVHQSNPLPPLPREITEEQHVHYRFNSIPD